MRSLHSQRGCRSHIGKPLLRVWSTQSIKKRSTSEWLLKNKSVKRVSNTQNIKETPPTMSTQTDAKKQGLRPAFSYPSLSTKCARYRAIAVRSEESMFPSGSQSAFCKPCFVSLTAGSWAMYRASSTVSAMSTMPSAFTSPYRISGFSVPPDNLPTTMPQPTVLIYTVPKVFISPTRKLPLPVPP